MGLLGHEGHVLESSRLSFAHPAVKFKRPDTCVGVDSANSAWLKPAPGDIIACCGIGCLISSRLDEPCYGMSLLCALCKCA